MTEWEEQELKKMVEKYDAVTIPVHTRIEAEQRVLDMDTAKEILSKAEIISLEDCYCRENLKNCNNPVDVCLSIDKAAQSEIESGRAKSISLRESLSVLERSHKAGLVHLAFSQKGKDTTIICSCCSCCCHHLSALQRFGYHDVVVKSGVIVQVDKSLCTECGTCVDRCQFGAWSWEGDTPAFNAASCFGCGVCVSTCPAGAISLVPRC